MCNIAHVDKHDNGAGWDKFYLPRTQFAHT